MDIVIKRKDSRVVITTVCDLQEIAVNVSMTEEEYTHNTQVTELGDVITIVKCPACDSKNEYHEIQVRPLILTEDVIDIAATALDISYRNET